jgi:hypothetical protein
LKTPILFIVFNRIETTEVVFEQIRKYRPERLYIAADGPRIEKPGEEQKCLEVRQLFQNIDWPCDVKYMFREANFGCRKGVPAAIDWFFKNETEGIILEDDIVPNGSFFLLMEELLVKYRDDHKVASISGCNLISSKYKYPESYFFSHYPNIWGWASWKRAWDFYDSDMLDWTTWSQKNLKNFKDKTAYFESYWQEEMNHIVAGADSWDHQFIFSCWKNNFLHIIPRDNLIENIGFGVAATHTTGNVPQCLVESKQKDMQFPLKHPKGIVRNVELDKLINKYIYLIGLVTLLKLKLKRLPIVGRILYKIKAILNV